MGLKHDAMRRLLTSMETGPVDMNYLSDDENRAASDLVKIGYAKIEALTEHDKAVDRYHVLQT